MYRKLLVVVPHELEVPEKATHYFGQLLDEPTFVYHSTIGAVGDHWWYWSRDRKEWIFYTHHEPSFLKRLPEVQGQLFPLGE